MINRGGPGSYTPPTGGTTTTTSGGSLLNRRGPTDPNLTQDYYGAYQAPPPATETAPVASTYEAPNDLMFRRGPTAPPIQQGNQPLAEHVALAGGGNANAPSFWSVGSGAGSFGQEQRRRLARGPMTGLSITPEMVKRAAMRRLG